MKLAASAPVIRQRRLRDIAVRHIDLGMIVAYVIDAYFVASAAVGDRACA